LPTESHDVTFIDIEKIKTEKPVAVLHPVPPAPPLLILPLIYSVKMVDNK
jgi:hypothetical protein